MYAELGSVADKKLLGFLVDPELRLLLLEFFMFSQCLSDVPLRIVHTSQNREYIDYALAVNDCVKVCVLCMVLCDGLVSHKCIADSHLRF